MKPYTKTVKITILAKDKDQARDKFNFIIGKIQERAEIRVVKTK